jgi:hypothetical protein
MSSGNPLYHKPDRKPSEVPRRRAILQPDKCPINVGQCCNWPRLRIRNCYPPGNVCVFPGRQINLVVPGVIAPAGGRNALPPIASDQL